MKKLWKGSLIVGLLCLALVGEAGTPVSITNSNSGNTVRVGINGAALFTTEGIALLNDPFDGTTIDTTDRWNSPVLAGTGTITQASGVLSLNVGTTASNAAALVSQETFSPPGPAFTTVAALITMEAPVASGLLRTNVDKFFGVGLPNASYTALTPLQDAIGLEQTIDGRVSGVVWNNNVKVCNKDMTDRFSDGFPHIFFAMIRADVTVFFIDDAERPFATCPGVAPQTTQLPVRIHIINHTSGPAVAPTMSLQSLLVNDSSAAYPMVFNGKWQTRQRSPSIFIPLSAVGIASETTIWTPAAGRRFRLMGYVLTSGTVGGNVTLKDNTGGATKLVLPFGAAAATLVSQPMGNGILSVTPGNVLTATGTATQTLSGYLYGTEE